jgi:hypothetical protein
MKGKGRSGMDMCIYREWQCEWTAEISCEGGAGRPEMQEKKSGNDEKET